MAPSLTGVNFSQAAAAAAAKSLQSCPTLCDSIDGNPPGSSVPGILQARILARDLELQSLGAQLWVERVKLGSLLPMAEG